MSTLDVLAEKRDALWIKLCEKQGVPPESYFVVFDDSDPLTQEYNAAAIAYNDAYAKQEGLS